MGRIPVDLTSVGISEGNKIGIVQKVEYQVKVGEKWNKDGTATVDFGEMINHPVEKQRIHITIFFPEENDRVWHDLYLMEKAKGFVKAFCDACQITYDAEGFDADDLLNKEVGVTISMSQDAGYESRPNITKVWKV